MVGVDAIESSSPFVFEIAGESGLEMVSTGLAGALKLVGFVRIG